MAHKQRKMKRWGHGRRKRGARILKFSAKKGCFLNFEGEKSNLTTFDPPWKKSFRRPWVRIKIIFFVKRIHSSDFYEYSPKELRLPHGSGFPPVKFMDKYLAVDCRKIITVLEKFYGFFVFLWKTTFILFTKSVKLTKQLEKRYDTNKSTLETFSSHAEVVQYSFCPLLEALKALILSGMLSIWVLQNQVIFFL